MKEAVYPDYEMFGNELNSKGLMVSPAEVHGLLCGMLAAGQSMDGDWLSPVNDLLNDGQGLPAPIKAKLATINETSYQGMSDPLLSFELFLPDDEAPIEDRAQSLAQWVQSFLLGFGLLQNELKSLNDDVQELINDFTEISQLSSEFDEDDEENEQALFQVVEYVRVGALTVFAHLSTVQTDGSKPTLH